MTTRRASSSSSAASSSSGASSSSAASSGGGAFSVAVRVRPGAGRTRVGGCYDGPHGAALIVAVGAPAVDGKATEAVRRALADALGLRPADVELRLGVTSRDKVFTVRTDDRSSGRRPVRREGSVDVGTLARRLAVLRDGSG
jgi:uncharacterized protein YggU (UPF0235/DUF167 family)